MTTVVIAALVAASSCTTQDLAFRRDDRVEIIAPEDRAEVELPFELRWTVTGFEVGQQALAGTGQYFAVFVDRAPMAPGQHIDSLATESCERVADCPDEEWLADHFVHVTTDTRLRIERLPRLSDSNRTGARDLHEIVIVLMGDDDKRMGEAAYWVELFHRRSG